MWMSGFEINTWSEMYNSGDSTSVYSKILTANPTWGHNDVMIEIASLINKGDTGLWKDLGTYRIRERDLISPFIDTGDSTAYQISDGSGDTLYSDFGTGVSISLGSFYSMIPGDSLRFSNYHSKLRRNYYGDTSDIGVRARVRTIDVDNGSSQSVVKVYDPNGAFRYGDTGDSIILYDLGDSTDGGDSNEGIYMIILPVTGDSDGDTSVITLSTTMPGVDQGDSGGFLQMYEPPWTLKGFRYSFLWDRELSVFQSPSKKIKVQGAAATEPNNWIYSPSGVITLTSSTTATLVDDFIVTPSGTAIVVTGGYKFPFVFPWSTPPYFMV